MILDKGIKLKFLVPLIFSIILISSSITYVLSASPTIVIGPATGVSTASYIIYQEGSTYYARNGRTGAIDYSGISASTVIQSSLNALTAGRTWKERVLLTGYFVISVKITIPSFTILEIDGVLTLDDDVNTIFIENSDTVGGNNDIEIIGGIIECNKNNQVGSDIEGIHFEKVTNFKLERVQVNNALHDGFDFDSCFNGTVSYCIAEDNGKTGFHPSTNTERMLFSDCISKGNGIDLASDEQSAGYCLVTTNKDISFDDCLSIRDYNGLRLQGTRISWSGNILYPVKYAIYNHIDVQHYCYSATIRGYFQANSTVTTNFIYLPRTEKIIFDHTTIISYNSYQAINGLGSGSQIIGGVIHNQGGRAVEVGASKTDIQILGVIMYTDIFYPIDLTSATNCIIKDNNFEYVGNAIRNVGSGCIVKDNIGFVTENKGISTGTGAQQTIAHGLAGTPDYVFLSDIEIGADAYQSASADATNIYVTATVNQDYAWNAIYEP